MEKYGSGSIVVADYDPSWPTLFEQERIRIRKALGSFALVIEHIGSTAVPGLPSKPIIDLLVGVPSLEEAKERCIEPFEELGYIFTYQNTHVGFPVNCSSERARLDRGLTMCTCWSRLIGVGKRVWSSAIICARILKQREPTLTLSAPSPPRR
jgi:GrpB-like predicted nucleotidyltransferase (UPF0157 family)